MLSRRTVLAAGAALLAAPAAAADYAEVLSQAYGGPVDALALHRIARLEIARLHARADRLLRRVDLSRGSVAERLSAWGGNPNNVWPDDESGRAMAIVDMTAWLQRTEPLIEGAFAGLPLPEPQVRELAAENAARGGYREPPVYYVDLRSMGTRPKGTLASVAFHETIPGHALQAAVSGRPRPGSFSEAWAVYAEQLMADLGVYEGNVADEIGYLHWRLFRMGRVAADTGMGVLGWSAEEAVTALRGIQGFSVAFVTMEADAARMRRDPGVYAAQGLGALAIASARPRRRRDWPAFHRAILADGPWPCAMLAAPATGGRR